MSATRAGTCTTDHCGAGEGLLGRAAEVVGNGARALRSVARSGWARVAYPGLQVLLLHRPQEQHLHGGAARQPPKEQEDVKLVDDIIKVIRATSIKFIFNDLQSYRLLHNNELR